MRIAAASWRIGSIGAERDFLEHLQQRIETAAGLGADLIVLPEQIDLELLSLTEPMAARSEPEFLASFGPALEEATLRAARETGTIVVAGSAFTRLESGVIVNRSRVVGPQGIMLTQDKQCLTQYERVEWGIHAGDGLGVLHDPPLGVLICYDSEFPEAARMVCEAGALILAVPAYTESLHGFHRVRESVRARAIENQIFAVHASLVGGLGREPVVHTYGSSAIIAPPIGSFPPDGVLHETAMGAEAVAVADVDFPTLMHARQEGDVRNWNDRLRSWRLRPSG